MQRSWPVAGGRVTPHGAYRFWRTEDHLCRGNPPCMHWGVDVAGAQGAAVLSPTGGVVVELATVERKPWTGYAPIVLILGDDGYYHLLAHVPSTVSVGARVRAGEQVATIGSAKHVHWEVRRARAGSSATNTVDPIAWLEGSAPGRIAPAVQSATGGDEWVLLLLLLLLSPRGSTRSRR